MRHVTTSVHLRMGMRRLIRLEEGLQTVGKLSQLLVWVDCFNFLSERKICLWSEFRHFVVLNGVDG